MSNEDRTHTLSFTARSADHYTIDTTEFGRGTENRTLVNRLKAYYFTTKLYPQTDAHFLVQMHICLAGDDGLEPPHVGIKIRCLTNLANPLQNPEFLKSNKTKNPLDFHLRGFGKYTDVSLSTCQTPSIILNGISKLWA